MQIENRQVAIDPSDLTFASIFLHECVHGGMEDLTERTFGIRIFHYHHSSAGVAESMVALIHRSHHRADSSTPRLTLLGHLGGGKARVSHLTIQIYSSANEKSGNYYRGRQGKLVAPTFLGS